MLRVVFGPFAILWLCAAVMLTADAQTTKDTKNGKDIKDEKCKCTITKVDAKAGTITVKMKDKDGKGSKDVEKTFKLTEDIHYFDSTGKAVSIDVFESGNLVLVVEREGKLKEMHKQKDKSEKSAGK
jgi:hypothetical protein